MSRILIAWEFGSNYGHLVACLRIARLLRKRGHSVVFAVRDTRAAAEILGPDGFVFVQAPMLSRRARPSRPPANYSEMLLGEGYADHQGLLGAICAWRSLIHLSRSDVIVAEYAPSALLAAYSMDKPRLAIANGFGVPPNLAPLPSIRPWETMSPMRLVQADRDINLAISIVMEVLGILRSPTLTDLYQGALLTVFSELDPFGPRTEGNYVGPIFALPDARAATWPEGATQRILAYLRPDIPGFPALMDALSATSAHVICVVPGLRGEQVSRFSTDRLQISTSPMALDSVLPGANAFVSYGGSAVVCQSLLAGVPLVVVPRFIEQHLNAKCAEAIGAAVVVEANRRREDFEVALANVLGEPAYRTKAQSFADKYAHFDSEQSVERVAHTIERRAVSDPTSRQAMKG